MHCEPVRLQKIRFRITLFRGTPTKDIFRKQTLRKAARNSENKLRTGRDEYRKTKHPKSCKTIGFTTFLTLKPGGSISEVEPWSGRVQLSKLRDDRDASNSQS